MTERGQNIMTKEKLLAVGDAMESRLAADRLADEKYR
jgi:NADH-quinone oxidoreductase subunit I